MPTLALVSPSLPSPRLPKYSPFASIASKQHTTGRTRAPIKAFRRGFAEPQQPSAIPSSPNKPRQAPSGLGKLQQDPPSPRPPQGKRRTSPAPNAPNPHEGLSRGSFPQRVYRPPAQAHQTADNLATHAWRLPFCFRKSIRPKEAHTTGELVSSRTASDHPAHATPARRIDASNTPKRASSWQE